MLGELPGYPGVRLCFHYQGTMWYRFERHTFEPRLYGCGSKNRYQNGTLVSGNMDQNLRNSSCLIMSHTHIYHFGGEPAAPVLTTKVKARVRGCGGSEPLFQGYEPRCEQRCRALGTFARRQIWLWLKKMYQTGTLVDGIKD